MNVAIYCGSAFGKSAIYEQETKKLAKKLHENSMHIVYGGSIQGLMGIISNESLKLGNKVTGVITYDLAHKEIENKAISEIYKVAEDVSREVMDFIKNQDFWVCIDSTSYSDTLSLST